MAAPQSYPNNMKKQKTYIASANRSAPAKTNRHATEANPRSRRDNQGSK